MSAADDQQLAHMTVQTLKSIRNEGMFDLYWTKVNQFASYHDVNEARLPRQRKRPRRYEEGPAVSVEFFLAGVQLVTLWW